MEKIKVGITIGDVNGIGLEVILKTLIDERITQLCTPVVYGSSKVMSYHRNIVQLDSFQYKNIRSAERLQHDTVNIVNCWDENVNIQLGRVNEDGGSYALKSLHAAAYELESGYIDALVTAPIHKHAMQMAGFQYPGHTEFFTEKFKAEESLMFMVNDGLRVGLATNHIPLAKVATVLNEDIISKKLMIMNQTLKKDFGLDKPKIAVLALNPHAGDGGLIGEEEKTIIQPALKTVEQLGILAFGPYPADGFFGSRQYKQFDGILAMYHDQGLVPFKTLSFGAGVNYTAGLPIIRTSPDHGTGHDIAGQNIADPASFRSAIFLALDVARNRRNFFDMHSNSLDKNKLIKMEQTAEDVTDPDEPDASTERDEES